MLVWQACGISKISKTSERESTRIPNPSDSFLYQGLNWMFKDSLSQAEEAFKQFITLNPDEAVGYFYLAGLKMNDKYRIDFVAVEKYSEKAFALHPENKWYRMMYADALAYNNKFKEGAALYEALIQQKDYQEEYFTRLLYYLQIDEQYKKMLYYIDIADQHTTLDDDEIDAWKLNVYDKMNDEKKRQEVLERLAARDPNNLDKKLALAAYYKNTNQNDKAKEIYKEIIQNSHNPAYKTAYYFVLIQSEDTAQLKQEMFNVYIYQQDTAEISSINEAIFQSIEAYPLQSFIVRTLTEIASNNKAHYLSAAFLSSYYAALDQEDSMGQYTVRAFDLGAKDIGLYTQAVSYFLNKQQYQELIDFGNTTSAKIDSFGIAFYGNALAFSLLQKDDSVLVAARKGLDNAGKDYMDNFRSELYALMGDAYHRLKNNIASDASYDSALVYNPKNATALNNYAYYLSVRNERLQTALEMSEKSLIIEENQPSYLDTYGWILYQLGRYEEAQKYINQAISLSPQPSADLWDHIGDVEYKLANLEKAKKYWQLAIEAGGDASYIQQKINQLKNEK